MDKTKLWRNLREALIAVLAGNAVYFLLMPYLPPKARHVPFRQDVGLVVAFWFCMVAFGILRMLPIRSSRERR